MEKTNRLRADGTRGILFSRSSYGGTRTEIEKEFSDQIKDLMENDAVLALDGFNQHINTSRLSHSLNVSYYSFRLSKIFGFNAYLAARAGLMHDLFLYDWRQEKKEEHHAFAHPKEALKTANSITKVSPIEENAILSHMWPLSKIRPIYAEAFAVNIADKLCCALEVCVGITRKAKAVMAIPLPAPRAKPARAQQSHAT